MVDDGAEDMEVAETSGTREKSSQGGAKVGIFKLPSPCRGGEDEGGVVCEGIRPWASLIQGLEQPRPVNLGIAVSLPSLGRDSVRRSKSTLSREAPK